MLGVLRSFHEPEALPSVDWSRCPGTKGREARPIDVYGYPSAEACVMGYQLVEQLRRETHEAMVRVINQRLGRWRSQLISVGLRPDKHVKSELLEETEEDGFGNVESRF
jgi:hypothetical protein